MTKMVTIKLMWQSNYSLRARMFKILQQNANQGVFSQHKKQGKIILTRKTKGLNSIQFNSILFVSNTILSQS